MEFKEMNIMSLIVIKLDFEKKKEAQIVIHGAYGLNSSRIKLNPSLSVKLRASNAIP